MNFLFRYRKFLVLIGIAGVLRLWQLGAVPVSPDWDEAALGYNAYSILKTGRDEYGTKFPLTIRSYDDYKPPLYVYLTIPSIAVFGLSVWSVRLPSALCGILAVLGTYLLVEELFRLGNGTKRSYQQLHWYVDLPFLSALLLAISPWHIQFSRIAFEANTGVMLNIFGVLSFLKGRRSRYWLWFSALCFGLGFYAYHSERIFVPLLVLVLAVLFRKILLRRKSDVLGAMVVGLMVVLPLVPVLLDKTTLMRLRGTSALADETGLLARTVKFLEDDKRVGDRLGLLVDNRRLVWVKTITAGYLSHYSFRWLFLNGDNARHHAPDMGMMYLIELPFFLWGIVSVLRSGGKSGVLLFTWFLIAPIAASPTTELPHGIRTLVFLPVPQIFTAAGFISVLDMLLKKRFIGICFISLIATAVALNMTYYLHMYFGHMNREYSQFWQYGYKQTVAYASAHRQKYSKIVVSTKLEQPHMFFLFYLHYDPLLYIQLGGTKSGGFAETHNAFDQYEFRPIAWAQERHDGSILYIGKPNEIEGNPLQIINYLDGSPAVKIAE